MVATGKRPSHIVKDRLNPEQKLKSLKRLKLSKYKNSVTFIHRKLTIHMCVIITKTTINFGYSCAELYFSNSINP